jgi:hypothetical protein
VWAGAAMLVWGGCCDPQGAELFDGAGYDPATDGWWNLPAAPLAPRQLHTAVWTGDRMVVWGGRAGLEEYPPDAAGYQAADAVWERMRRGPLVPRAAHTAVWTGDRMVVWGGCCTAGQEGYADGAALPLSVQPPSPAPTPSPSPSPPDGSAPVSPPAPPERGTSPLLAIVLAGGAVIVLALAGLLALRRRRTG